jgi:hypothetical protein
MEKCLDLHLERQIGRQDVRQQLAARLDRPLGPAVLLRFERIHLDRHFGRRDEIRQEQELPSTKLRAVTEIEIFRQRIVLPAARVADRHAPPHARRAVEVEEAAGPVAAAVLEHEVPVEQIACTRVSSE